MKDPFNGIPAIGLGCARLRGAAGEAAIWSTLREGVRHFDTA